MRHFFKRFFFAFIGLKELVLNERNFSFHLLALIVVIVAGFCFKITSIEWLILLLISALVICLEAINTAIEKLCDLYSTAPNQQIKVIKDIAAAAVLISAIFALFIGFLIFNKYILSVFS